MKSLCRNITALLFLLHLSGCEQQILDDSGIDPQRLNAIKALPMSRLAWNNLDYYADGRWLDQQGVVIADYRSTGKGFRYNPNAIGSYGINFLSEYAAFGDPASFELFLQHCDWLQSNVKTNQAGYSSWTYEFDHLYIARNSDFALSAPWFSGLSTAKGLALLARAYYLTGESQYRDTIRLVAPVLNAFVEDGGLKRRTADKRAMWFEEYPTKSPSMVLNGHIQILLSLHDLSVLVGDEFPLFTKLFQEGVRGLDHQIDNYSVRLSNDRIVSRYDLVDKEKALTFSFSHGLLPDQPQLKVRSIALVGDTTGTATIDVGSEDTESLWLSQRSGTWGEAETDGVDSYRFAFQRNEHARFAVSKFTMAVPGGAKPEPMKLVVSYSSPPVGKSLVQARLGKTTLAIGEIVGSGDGEDSWSSQAFEIPPELLTADLDTSLVNYNPAYHRFHIALLYYLGVALGDEQKYAPTILEWLPELETIGVRVGPKILRDWLNPIRIPQWLKDAYPLQRAASENPLELPGSKP